jgi:ribosomal protein S18 acetylase RimI-like enzyme
MIVGVFLFIPEKHNEFRVLVNPKMLNRGYGKKITQKAIEIGMKELQYKGISLIVRKEHAVAISLYRKMGFQIVGETIEKIEGEAVDFYRMYLDLE